MIFYSSIESARATYGQKSEKITSSSVDKEFCAFVFIALSREAYLNPERIAACLARHEEVESVDVVAGKWGLILRIRTKSRDKFYDFLTKKVCKESGVAKANSIVSLKQIKPICFSLDQGFTGS